MHTDPSHGTPMPSRAVHPICSAFELGEAGFDHSVLCEFRGRLLAADAGERLLARVLDAARALGLLKARGRQRTDATHVLIHLPRARTQPIARQEPR